MNKEAIKQIIEDIKQKIADLEAILESE